MAEGGCKCGARAPLELHIAVLPLRAPPAERAERSLRSYVASWAIYIGVHTFVMGIMFTEDWISYEVLQLMSFSILIFVSSQSAFHLCLMPVLVTMRKKSTIEAIAAGSSFLAAITNFMIWRAIDGKSDDLLHYTLLAAFVVYKIYIPMTFMFISSEAFKRDPLYILWEMPRFVMCLLHLILVCGLLLEMAPEDQVAAPPADGWLKTNQSDIDADEALHKVNIEPSYGTTNLDNVFFFPPQQQHARQAAVQLCYFVRPAQLH